MKVGSVCAVLFSMVGVTTFNAVAEPEEALQPELVEAECIYAQDLIFVDQDPTAGVVDGTFKATISYALVENKSDPTDPIIYDIGHGGDKVSCPPIGTWEVDHLSVPNLEDGTKIPPFPSILVFKHFVSVELGSGRPISEAPELSNFVDIVNIWNEWRAGSYHWYDFQLTLWQYFQFDFVDLVPSISNEVSNAVSATSSVAAVSPAAASSGAGSGASGAAAGAGASAGASAGAVAWSGASPAGAGAGGAAGAAAGGAGGSGAASSSPGQPGQSNAFFPSTPASSPADMWSSYSPSPASNASVYTPSYSPSVGQGCQFISAPGALSASNGICVPMPAAGGAGAGWGYYSGAPASSGFYYAP